MKFDRLDERWIGTGKSRNDPSLQYDVYLNPTKNELKELSRDNNLVRFIAYNGDFYVFSASYLHRDAIQHLKLPFNHKPDISTAFLGIAKLSVTGNLTFHDSNQLDHSNSDMVLKFHPYVVEFFGE